MSLLDYVFPDGTGKELCERIRESDPDTPILFFSASHPSVRQEAVKSGAHGFVLKPEFGYDRIVVNNFLITSGDSNRAVHT